MVNMVERLSFAYEFHIVTRNYDGPGDKRPYPNINSGEWITGGIAKIQYLSNDLINKKYFSKIIHEVKPDAIFLNSVFGTLPRQFLLLRRREKLYEIPVVLAPCGELSAAALSLKKTKKRAYLTLSKLYGMYKGVLWKASAEMEKDEVINAIGKNAEVMIAPDLPPLTILPDFSVSQKPSKVPGELIIAFVSRIVRKKNLHFLLKALSGITKGKVRLNIVGTIEDKQYWELCEGEMAKLPSNVSVNVIGGVRYDQALEYLVSSHVFALPTLHENFGYVFVEALSAGCPIIISERTIWNDLEKFGIGSVVNIDSVEKWHSEIESYIELDQDSFNKMSADARSYSVNWLSNPDLQSATERVFASVV